MIAEELQYPRLRCTCCGETLVLREHHLANHVVLGLRKEEMRKAHSKCKPRAKVLKMRLDREARSSPRDAAWARLTKEFSMSGLMTTTPYDPMKDARLQ